MLHTLLLFMGNGLCLVLYSTLSLQSANEFDYKGISEEIILRLAASEGGRVVKIRHEIKSSMESALGDKNMSSLSKLLKTKN